MSKEEEQCASQAGRRSGFRRVRAWRGISRRGQCRWREDILSRRSGKCGSGSSGCQLQSAGGKIKHVIYIQFDNVHYSRTFSSVPSDMQEMPNLLNFLKGNGTFLTNEHGPYLQIDCRTRHRARHETVTGIQSI